MVLRYGSKGNEVRELQEFLGISADGVFGKGTETAVKRWQQNNGLSNDGIVGPATWDAMGVATTDSTEKTLTTKSGLIINQHYLPKGEYKQGPVLPEYLFIHHTAGRENPYNTIDSWGRDTRGAVATEFVIGGQSIDGKKNTHDGEIVQSFPEGGYGWHLGKNGSQHMHIHSVGIEVNNFAYLTKGGYMKDGVWVNKLPESYYTYAGVIADKSQIVKLDKPFRGHSTWHRYSDLQIESLREIIILVGERDGIDVRMGLPTWIRDRGVDAFEWNEEAYYGKVKGLLTHSNTRKDKSDMFPQPELVDMLLSL